MAKKNPIVLGNGLTFDLQGDCLKYFQELLNSFNIGTEISATHESFSDIYHLYLRHPELLLKSGCIENIEYFKVDNSGQYNSKCFHTIHKDGSIADWSYKGAVTCKLKSKFQCFSDAARYDLEKEFYSFRDNEFSQKCITYLNFKGYTSKSLPENWISLPEKLQYRSMLNEPIKTEFSNWYKENYPDNVVEDAF